MTEPHLTFSNQNEWEDWLAQNGDTSTGVWLRLATLSGRWATRWSRAPIINFGHLSGEAPRTSYLRSAR
jgi:hypothetical protein